MNISKASLDKITAELIDNELRNQTKDIRVMVIKYVSEYMKTKHFQRTLKNECEKSLKEWLNDTDVLDYLDSREFSDMAKKAIRGMFK